MMKCLDMLPVIWGNRPCCEVNPYGNIPGLYSEATERKCKDSTADPGNAGVPHLFSVANCAYQAMITNAEDQSAACVFR